MKQKKKHPPAKKSPCTATLKEKCYAALKIVMQKQKNAIILKGPIKTYCKTIKMFHFTFISING